MALVGVRLGGHDTSTVRDVPRGIRLWLWAQKISQRRAGWSGRACWPAGSRKSTRRLFSYRRVQVCDLHRTFSTQPFMLSELPETVPEPL